MRPTATIAALVLGAWIPLASSCGGAEQVELDGRGDGGGGGGSCTPAKAQCNNCIDDDGDGLIDGDDPECTGPLDDDESSFATGIPGDNIDPRWQDCFFDGNSGGGDDGCRLHTCCLLGATGGGDCPVDRNFDPATDCPVQSQRCIDFCAPLAPAGCDCFGCCTICHDGSCHDVYINPAVAPDCDLDVLGDPTKCPSCTPITDCGSPCDGECVLCPGQTIDDLPPECNDQNECPGNQTPCMSNGDCLSNQFCNTGCCVFSIE
jgi:hypothetical protein